jgi:hypothetical protein
MKSSTLEKIKNEALEHGLTFIKEIGNQNNLYRFNDCNHTNIISQGKVRVDQFSCPSCFKEKLKKEAKLQKLTLVEHKKGNKNTYLFKKCKHIQDINHGHVRTGEFRCEECLCNKLKDEALNQGIEYIKRMKGHKNLYRFPSCGHTQEINVGHVRTGAFCCNDCGEGYATKKSGLYILKITDNKNKFSWLKFGVARDIKRRISQYKLNDAKVEVLLNIEIETNIEAIKIEKQIHKKYKEKVLDFDLMKSYMASGFTECYNLNMLGKLKKDIA